MKSALLMTDEPQPRLFLARDGTAHPIHDGEFLRQQGISYPDDFSVVSSGVIDCFRPGRHAARRYSDREWRMPARDSSVVMREIAASRLSGVGVEFGAGASPFPVPIDCTVSYADLRNTIDLRSNRYPGQELEHVQPVDLVASFDDQSAIPSASLDFVVACHVIEHTRNPIKAIAESHRTLKPGGQLVLVVPDMTRTFDRNRPVTPLSHVVADYLEPSDERDLLDYYSFYELAFVTPKESLDAVVKKNFDDKFPIHFHTWTYDSFAQLVGYVNANVAAWSSAWSQPTLDHPEHDIEFYFVLQK